MFRTFLLASLLAAPALAQTPTPRPGRDLPAPIMLPDDTLIAPQQAPQAAPAPPPAQPQAPVMRGGFEPLEVTPPTFDELYTQGSVTYRANFEQKTVDYIRYTPGGSIETSRRPIVIVTPPGQNLLGAVEDMDLRIEARASGRALIATNAQITPPSSSTQLEERVDQRFETQNDPQETMRVVNAILQQESLFEAPTIVGLEGTGTIFQSYLCEERSTTRFPDSLFLFEGSLNYTSAAGCRPPRIPQLVLYRYFESTSTPYAGGEVPRSPGQATEGRVLSAAAARGFWALKGGCDETPDLQWIDVPEGRLALEKHQSCTRGGPVSMLTALESDLDSEKKSILVRTFLNGNLLGQ